MDSHVEELKQFVVILGVLRFFLVLTDLSVVVDGQVVEGILALQRHLIRHVSNKRIKIEALSLRLLQILWRWALRRNHASEWLLVTCSCRNLIIPLSILLQLIIIVVLKVLIVMIRILHKSLWLLSLICGLLKWEEVVEGLWLLLLLLGGLLLGLLVEGNELDGDAFLGLRLVQVRELFGLADAQQIKLTC